MNAERVPATSVEPLPHLRIGPVDIGFPAVQAALSGYSDWPMRAIARRLGASYTLCEVLLDQFILNVTKGRKARRFIRVEDDEHPCGAQLMGAEPAEFPPAALKLVEAGFDVIDLNFACPVKKVLGRCRGGYLLTVPQTALEIVARVREALPPRVPLTVKLRCGFDDSPESTARFWEIFDGCWRLGAAAVTVHGRTVRQRYVGPSRWSVVAEAKRAAGPRVVLGSGDLFTAEDCLRMIHETSVDGVTVARGAIGNPWIFRQVREAAAGRTVAWPSVHEQRDILAEHFRLAHAHYGPSACGPRMRKFGIKYSRLHPRAATVREAFISVTDLDDWQAVLDRWYADDEPGCGPPPPVGDGEEESC